MKKSLAKVITLALVSTLMLFVPTTINAKVYTISDVSKSDPYYQNIQKALNEGWMSIAGGKFLPNKFVTRADFALALTKFNGQLSEAKKITKSSFGDVTVKNSYYQYIELQRNNIPYYKINGVLTFKPKSYLSREDALVALVKMKGFRQVVSFDEDEDEGSELGLGDLIDDIKNINPNLKKYVEIGVMNELIDIQQVDDQNLLNPKKNITRRELANILANSQERADMSSVADDIDDNDSTPVTPPSDGSDSSSGEINISTILSNGTAVSKMLSIELGGAIDLSDIDPSMKGTVTKISEYAAFYNDPSLSKDHIELGNIVTNQSMEYDKENMASFEYFYNVVSADYGVIQVSFNTKGANTETTRAIWLVPKGSGILVFKIPVTPKQWVETPFRVSAGIMDYSSLRSLPVGYRVNLLPSDPGRISIF